MVVDTSAIAAILFEEPEAAGMIEALEAAPIRLLSVVSLVEATLVVEGRKGLGAGGLVDRLVDESEIELVPVAIEHARLACEAFRAYGRGRHPAGLNFGDCFAYALAKATGEPLLFQGDDFSRTDVAAA
jgi:ribonuclease VapC